MESYRKSKIFGLGGRGEDIAAAYIRNKGYKIIEKNYRTKFGEIDIISINPDGVLVFVEVKAISDTGSQHSSRGILPEDNLSRNKLKKLQRMGQFFSNANPALVGDDGWQIDLIAIVIGLKIYKIKHYENIF